MKNDHIIKKLLLERLMWEPVLAPCRLQVIVNDRCVHLFGSVDNFSQKIHVERVAARVPGLKKIFNDIEVGIDAKYSKTDLQIRDMVAITLNTLRNVPIEKISVSVHNGKVILEGEMDWSYQRIEAKLAVQNLLGIRSIVNLLTVQPRISAFEVQQNINAGFQRSAGYDASKIMVGVEGSKIILSGCVRSFAEQDYAENAAWSVPGVSEVECNLHIKVPDFLTDIFN